MSFSNRALSLRPAKEEKQEENTKFHMYKKKDQRNALAKTGLDESQSVFRVINIQKLFKTSFYCSIKEN